MADFDKLREAAEEIKLDDLQKQRILDACKGKKRRKINYTAVAGIAAVLVISFAVFSPGFLMQAKMADTAENEAAVEDYFFADQESDMLADGAYSQNSANSENGDGKYTYTADGHIQVVFDAEGFRSIYSSVYPHFVALVDYEEYSEWSSTVSAEDGMAIVQFVEHFGISREDFDRANREYARYIYDSYGTSPLYKASYSENEIYEIYNTELIYSSDRETIDEYYKAVEETDYPKESGAGSHSMPAEIIVPEEYYK